MDNKKELIEEMFEKGVLISEDFLNKEDNKQLAEKIDVEEDLMVLNSDYAEIISQQSSLVDWYEVDKYRVEAEKDRDDELYQSQLQGFKNSKLVIFNDKENKEVQKEEEIKSLETELNDSNNSSKFSSEVELSDEKEENLKQNSEIKVSLEENKTDFENPIEIVFTYENNPSKYKLDDFTKIFRSRYRFLENILRNRPELQSILPISRILQKKEKETVSLIGLVDEIRVTKNGHFIITLEELTGKIKILVSKNNKDLFEKAKDLVVDEIIGVNGKLGDNIIFAEKVVWPDLPSNREMKTSSTEEAAAFLSDLHFGSKQFLHKEFNRFLNWIKGDTGNETQRALAKKVKYIFIAGDLVEGIGIYPSQREELEIDDIRVQYSEFTKLLKQIPVDKKIIICPGNHDVVHIAEPQEVFYPDYAPDLMEMPNVIVVSNPGMVNIGKTKEFSGFDVLMYHGYSFDYYVSNVESIRNNGGYHRADLIMKFLLQRRHLAPSFKSTPYYPGFDEDPLLIKKIPDFFLTGHIHYSKVANYKGVTMICGSCWQDKTDFQEKLGHDPEPGRVPVVNLKTRDVKILKFM
jgi:DNA polymerase II small subunit